MRSSSRRISSVAPLSLLCVEIKQGNVRSSKSISAESGDQQLPLLLTIEVPIFVPEPSTVASASCFDLEYQQVRRSNEQTNQTEGSANHARVSATKQTAERQEVVAFTRVVGSR